MEKDYSKYEPIHGPGWLLNFELPENVKYAEPEIDVRFTEEFRLDEKLVEEIKKKNEKK